MPAQPAHRWRCPPTSCGCRWASRTPTTCSPTCSRRWPEGQWKPYLHFRAENAGQASVACARAREARRIGRMTTTEGRDLPAIEAERARIRDAHLRPAGQRAASTARGLHHTALISSDVEQTVRFYQGVLGFPLTELI